MYQRTPLHFPLLIKVWPRKILELLFYGHPKTQTMQTADCRLQTVQTMQTAQTVQTEYFFFLFLFLHLLLTRRCFGSGHIN